MSFSLVSGLFCLCEGGCHGSFVGRIDGIGCPNAHGDHQKDEHPKKGKSATNSSHQTTQPESVCACHAQRKEDTSNGNKHPKCYKAKDGEQVFFEIDGANHDGKIAA
ncbi:MAG: hypothetical protein IJ125_02915 [Atopobiaceae bacterium]|nr:hypothetical protein [Atopobiaceae bacterium]